MKAFDAYRDPLRARDLLRLLDRALTRPQTVMEVCGGQTHAIVRQGIDQLVPDGLTLVHGPGCPVCVTSVGLIDKAIEIASEGRTVFCSFGDMLRVPGTDTDLLRVRSEGGDVRVVYSPLDAVAIAQREAPREVVFFAVGFETTAPAGALAVRQARDLGLTNFSILCAHVRVPPAMEAILSAPFTQVDGFLAAGHVCAVDGLDAYENLCGRFGVPIVVTGFDPVDILHGLLLCVKQLEEGRCALENAYSRAVRPEGNPAARRLVAETYRTVDREWRGLGVIRRSGLRLRSEYARYDAERRFGPAAPCTLDRTACIAGRILQGLSRPQECSAFAGECTPEHPLGAPMVSGEGACAAYYRYRRPVASRGIS